MLIEVKSKQIDTEDFLAHHGVQGMKWGVRHDVGHEGERTKTKKIAKLDNRYARNAHSLNATIMIHNRAAQLTNEHDIERINNKPEYKNVNFLRDSPLRQKYYKEQRDAFLDNLQKAATELGPDASGTHDLGIIENGDSWDVVVKDVAQHADDNVVMHIKVTYDSTGHIIKVTPEAPNLQHDEFSFESEVDEYISHHGVLGMEWGKHKANLHPDYTPQQVKRDRQLYGVGGVKRINKRLHAGDTISTARGNEVTRRNSTLNRNKYVRPLGKGLGGLAGAAAANVAISLASKSTRSASGRAFLTKFLGNSGANLVASTAQAIDSVQGRSAATLGAAYIGQLLGGDFAVSANTRAGGYNPNRR